MKKVIEITEEELKLIKAMKKNPYFIMLQDKNSFLC
jgi:hypothetical protein